MSFAHHRWDLHTGLFEPRPLIHCTVLSLLVKTHRWWDSGWETTTNTGGDPAYAGKGGRCYGLKVNPKSRCRNFITDPMALSCNWAMKAQFTSKTGTLDLPLVGHSGKASSLCRRQICQGLDLQLCSLENYERDISANKASHTMHGILLQQAEWTRRGGSSMCLTVKHRKCYSQGWYF